MPRFGRRFPIPNRHTLPKLYTVPDAPTIGTAVRTSTTTADVPFTAPVNNGDSVITSYVATSTPGSLTGTLTQAGSGTVSVTGLTPATSYTFTVHATNGVGNSVESSASNSVGTFVTVEAIITSVGFAAMRRASLY